MCLVESNVRKEFGDASKGLLAKYLHNAHRGVLSVIASYRQSAPVQYQQRPLAKLQTALRCHALCVIK
jgi:hypothetical protein